MALPPPAKFRKVGLGVRAGTGPVIFTLPSGVRGAPGVGWFQPLGLRAQASSDKAPFQSGYDQACSFIKLQAAGLALLLKL